MAKAVFLDRDHTLNPDSGYISDPNKFDLYPWVPEELAKLKAAGHTKMSRSGLIRFALDHMDTAKLPKAY